MQFEPASLILDVATVRLLPSMSASEGAMPKQRALLRVYLPLTPDAEFKIAFAGVHCAYSDLEVTIRRMKKLFPAIRILRRQDVGHMTLMRMEEQLAVPMRRADIS